MAWGFLKRIGAVATGFGGAGKAAFGLVSDIGSAAFRNKLDIDDFIAQSWRATKKRGGVILENAIGPDEGLGAAIGALPESIGPRPIVREGTEAIEYVWREGISEPISTALTAASKAEAEGGLFSGAGWDKILSGETWRESYRIAQKQSPGQSFALTLVEDYDDPERVKAFQETGAYQWISGTTDAVLRLGLDPTVIGGKAAAAGRTRFLVRPITGRPALDRTVAVLTRLEEGSTPSSTLERLDQAMVARRLRKFATEAEGMNAAQIRHRFFPHHESGAYISSLLGDAEDATDIYRRMRVLVGDPVAAAEVREQSAALANQLDRARTEAIDMRKFGADDSLFFNPDEEARLLAEVDEMEAGKAVLELKTLAAGAMREVPRASLTGRLRASVSSSEVYQTAWYAAPVRRAFRMQHQLVNLHDSRSDIQVGRFLEHSTLDLDERDLLRGEYMAQTTDTDRLGVVLRIENRAVTKIAEDAGMTKDQIDVLLAGRDRTRRGVDRILKGRKYDGMDRSVVRFADEDGGVTEVPLWVSQNANVVPMVDITEVRKATEPVKRFLERHHVPGVVGKAGGKLRAGVEIPVELMDSFYKVWRPSVLLRGAWPIRVVGDEQLRIIAKIGAVAHMLSLNRARKGYPDFEHKGHLLEGPFGHPEDAANAYKTLAESRAAFEALGGRQYEGILGEARDAAQTGEWMSLTADRPEYAKAWLRDVNDQIGADVMGRKLLAGESVDDVVTWMTTTTEGQSYARRSVRGKRMKPDVIRRWVEDAEDQVESYTAGSLEIRQAALQGKATTAMLEKWVPDPALRPTVHGEILAQSLANSKIMRTWSKVTDAGYRVLGSLPSDTLSRHPFFDAMYQAEAKRLIDIADGTHLGADDIARIEKQARDYALNETQDLLYNLAEQSDLAGTLRHMTPFLSAWGEVLSRWAGLTVQNPAFVARARQVWLSPERAGMVVDEDGNLITEKGATNALGEQVKAGKERFVVIPQALADLMPGITKGTPIKFNKKSANMVLSGWPGFGPPVTVPLNEIAKDRPGLEAVVDFALPFGTTQEVRTLIMPTLARNVSTRAEGDENRQFALTKIRIFNDMLVDYNLGKRVEPPTEAEAKSKADSYWSVRTYASFISPVSLSFASPYQSYIDAFRQARERLAEDPLALADEQGNERSADEWFLDTYGEEFFPLTQSLSQSKDGVPPTLEGFVARGKYKDLIEEFPDLGSLIIGAEGAGEFSGAVYDYQLAHKLAPGSPDAQRETPAFGEAIVRPDVRHGWIEFTRAMDIIEHERIARGLPNLQVKKAKDLAQLKGDVITSLANKHPEWFKDFSEGDRLKWDRKIAALTRLSQDSRLQQRSEFRVLGEYLDARQVILGELAEREERGKPKTLTATANQDLATLWNDIVGNLVEKDLAFSDLYYRYLDRDPIREEQVAGFFDSGSAA